MQQFASVERTRLEEHHLGALEGGSTRCWRAGRHQETVGELEALTGAHPLRERFWHQRLLALYRCGRQAEALRAYRELRSTLVDQLGIEPRPELRELEAESCARTRRSCTARVESRPRWRRNPQTCYVESSGVHIAYQVVGDGER